MQIARATFPMATLAALLAGGSCDTAGLQGWPEAGPPACGPSNCAGCCLPDANGCMTGTDDWYCGSGGSVCHGCGIGQECRDFVCVETCNRYSCWSGCCVGDACLPGDTDDACGDEGRPCSDCRDSGQHCALPGVVGPVEAGTCVNCMFNGDCAADQVCLGNTCVAAWGANYFVSAADIRLPDTKPDGSPWDIDTDPSERLPDPEIYYRVGEGSCPRNFCDSDTTEPDCFCGFYTDIFEGDRLDWEIRDSDLGGGEEICAGGGSVRLEWLHDGQKTFTDGRTWSIAFYFGPRRSAP